MLATRISRNAIQGNRMVYGGPLGRGSMVVGAGALAGLTVLVYWVGYRAEGEWPKRNMNGAAGLQTGPHIFSLKNLDADTATWDMAELSASVA